MLLATNEVMLGIALLKQEALQTSRARQFLTRCNYSMFLFLTRAYTIDSGYIKVTSSDALQIKNVKETYFANLRELPFVKN